MHIGLRGELSTSTVLQTVWGEVEDDRKKMYRENVEAILRKYPDHEMHIAGHSNGGMNLAQMLIDGVVDPSRFGNIYVVNTPMLRDR